MLHDFMTSKCINMQITPEEIHSRIRQIRRLSDMPLEQVIELERSGLDISCMLRTSKSKKQIETQNSNIQFMAVSEIPQEQQDELSMRKYSNR